MTDCGFPMIQYDEENGAPLVVEVHDCGEEVREYLDGYEGYPHLYGRDVVSVEMDDGTTKQAWIYIASQLSGSPYPANSEGVLNWNS